MSSSRTTFLDALVVPDLVKACCRDLATEDIDETYGLTDMGVSLKDMHLTCRGFREMVHEAVQGYSLHLKYSDAVHQQSTSTSTLQLPHIDADDQPGCVLPDEKLATFLIKSNLRILRIKLPRLTSDTYIHEPKGKPSVKVSGSGGDTSNS